MACEANPKHSPAVAPPQHFAQALDDRLPYLVGILIAVGIDAHKSPRAAVAFRGAADGGHTGGHTGGRATGRHGIGHSPSASLYGRGADIDSDEHRQSLSVRHERPPQ
ncbi:MAG: hypothetical protein BWY85_01432 [Firmicutes bacterium ADurb.Bin506]|nr:MAG: hypothetical protein BWY85_01432 [Firmicutes bacterium ADurb.Bin506]